MLDVERAHARIDRARAQFFLDAQQLVILGHALGAARRARLNLASVERHGQIGDGGILRLAAAVG